MLNLFYYLSTSDFLIYKELGDSVVISIVGKSKNFDLATMLVFWYEISKI